MVFVLMGVDATVGNGVAYKNTCTASGKGNISKVVPILFGWIYKTVIKLTHGM